MSDVIHGIGDERMKRFSPIRDALESGAIVVTGSDWPVVPIPNPWLAIETAMTRQAPGGSSATVGVAEAITLKQAIDLFTINAARALGVESQRGTLESGKAADFVVLDKDPFNIPVTDIHTVQVLSTYIDGEEVFHRDGSAAGKP